MTNRGYVLELVKRSSQSVAMLKKMKRIFYLLENTFEIQNKCIIFAE